MGPLSWIVLGAVAGYIARLLAPGRGVHGCLPTIALGVVGLLVGGTLANLIFDERWDISAAGIVGSIIGSLLVLVVLGAMRRR